MSPKFRAILIGVLVLLGGGGLLIGLTNPAVRGMLVRQQVEQVTVRGLVGGEKVDFLASPEVQALLRSRYGLTVEGTRAGSISMVRNPPPADADFLWPSNEVASEIYRQLYGTPVAEELVFNSPIVLLSWKPVVAALEAGGLVQRRDGVAQVDTARLVAHVRDGTPWADLGLPELTGRFAVVSTDPARSNSGNMFAGLLANTLNGGTPPTADDLPKIGPLVADVFARLGHLSRSSSDIFKQFLAMGMGAYPVIVAYENQLVEHYLANPRDRAVIRNQVEILYPTPTVWASHPVIALTPRGRRLIKALSDPDVQDLAWRVHGFRTGLSGISNDPAVHEIGGIPARILSVAPLPRATVVESLVDKYLTQP